MALLNEDSLFGGHSQVVGDNYEQTVIADPKAAFGYHRPEIRHVPDPLTHKEALKKYRKQAEPHGMGDYGRNIKRGMGQNNSVRNSTSRINKNSSKDLSNYLGATTGSRKISKNSF